MVREAPERGDSVSERRPGEAGYCWVGFGIPGTWACAEQATELRDGTWVCPKHAEEFDIDKEQTSARET